MTAIFRKSTPLLTFVITSLLLVGCGSGSSPEDLTSGEESITETTDRNDIAVQGTVWNFTGFQAADGSLNSTDENYSDNYIFLAALTESFQGNYGCADVTGIYSLNGNSLSITEQNSVSSDCTTSGSDYEANLALAKRVLAGPSTLSVSGQTLTLISSSNESLIFTPSQGE